MQSHHGETRLVISPITSPICISSAVNQNDFYDLINANCSLFTGSVAVLVSLIKDLCS